MEEDGVEQKKEKRVLWPNCPFQGRHGDWVGVRRMGLKEMRKHNVQSAFSPELILFLEPSFSLEPLTDHNTNFNTIFKVENV